MESWELTALVPIRFCNFFHSIRVKVFAPATQKVMAGSYKVLHLSRKNHDPKNWRSDAPKCNLSGKSAPSPPNISDETCLLLPRLPRKNVSLQILFKCPHACHRFLENATKTLTFFSLLTRCTNPLRLPRKNDASRSNSGASMWLLCAFLTSKCASRHNGVHFFDSSTVKSAPKLRCFCTFLTSKMCFRATNGVHFLDISTSKSAPELRCFVHFWLGNVLRATTACNFFISHLTTWLRTLASLLRPSGATNHWKKQKCFRDFSYLFAHLDLLSSHPFSFWSSFLLLFSSLTLPISAFHLFHIVGSLTSKLPSAKNIQCIVMYCNVM